MRPQAPQSYWQPPEPAGEQEIFTAISSFF
jgi:hypothetical protein